MAEIAPDYRIASDLNLEKLEQILKHKPDDSSLLFALGELALRRGRNLIALSAFTRLRNLNPKLEEVHLALAKIFAEQKLHEEAFREIAETLELNSGNVEARVLHDLFMREITPSLETGDRIKNSLRNSLDSQKVKFYLQQLTIERDLLLSDDREISEQLQTSPEETFLEYSRAIVARKLAQIEQLFAKVEELTGMGPDKHKPMDAALSLKGKKKDSLALRGRVILDLVKTLDPFILKIAHMKGVTGVFLTGLKGEIFHAAGEEAIHSTEVMKTLSGSLEQMWSWGQSPTDARSFSPGLTYWTMEFEGGLVVLETLAPKLFLLILTDSSVTFGALRYTLDKNLPLIQQAIGSLEISVLER